MVKNATQPAAVAWGFQPSFNSLSLLLFVRAIIKAPLTVMMNRGSVNQSRKRSILMWQHQVLPMLVKLF